MSAPAVSVILPTFNRANTLSRAIRSVLAQTFADFELIIVDDGSTDHTASVVGQCNDSRVQYLPLETNSGCSAARNAGIAVARGQWLAFQDSDDEWIVNKLEKQMQEVAALPAKDVVGLCSGVLRFTPRDVEWIAWPVEDSATGKVSVDALIAQYTAYLQSTLLRRDAVLQVGLFDERMATREDFDLCLRLAQVGALYADNAPLVLSYESADGIAGDRAKRIASSRRLLQSHRGLVEAKPYLWRGFLYDLAAHEIRGGAAASGRARLRGLLRQNPGFIRAWGLLLGSASGLLAVRDRLRQTR